MTNRKRQATTARSRRAKTTVAPRRPVRKVVVVALIGIVGLVVGAVTIRVNTPPVTDPASDKRQGTGDAGSPSSLRELLAMNPAALRSVDIGRRNLLCAEGLPGAENLDIGRCLGRLDAWATRVKSETERHLYQFRRAPDDYENSEGYFRMLMLVTVVQKDFGVHYNMQRVREVDFRRAQDLFIHGMIGNKNGGTCVSMPVLYTAVARRLGYPVRLVTTRAHIFCRWDSPGNRFNIEAAGRGLLTYPDKYYTTWPHKVSKAEVKANRYLISLSPAEELAAFLANRGHCLLDNGRAREAADAYTAARKFDPRNPAYRAWTRQAEARFKSPTEASRLHSFRAPPFVSRNRDPLIEVQRINARNRSNLPGMPPQPASPYGPGLSHPGFPQPGFPQPTVRNPHQPYPPQVPGAPPRR